MGYYKDNHKLSTRRHRFGIFMLGLVIGVILLFIAMPSLMASNVLPDKWMNQSTGTGDGVAGHDGVRHVSVDVTTQVTGIVKRESPAVVGVSNIQRQQDLFDHQENEVGTGSGVIYKKKNGYAYIITNHHVVEGADTIEVVLSDGTHVKAKLLGGDLFSDLAVLRIHDKHVKKVIQMGSSTNVNVGEPVIAIGNPLGIRFSGSVTQGIISGKQRTIPQDFNQDGRPDWQTEVLQTDAAINPGNSGGALLDMDGKLIGINSMKINEDAVEGIGFAIPIDTARPIINELARTGKVTRPYIGVEIYSLDEVPQTEWKQTLNLPGKVKGGVYVWRVEPLSPADKAGLKRLDVITHLDGKRVLNMIDLRKILYQEKQVGDMVEITYYQQGKKMTTKMKLGKQR